MIDYTIGDKVVCIDDNPVDCMKMLAYQVQGFQYPIKGHIYTVRDMVPPERLVRENFVGVVFHEISAGTGITPGKTHRGELWYNGNSFRKALPSDLATDAAMRRHLQPA